MSIVRIEDPKIFIGLSVAEARRQIADHGYDTRVVQSQTPYKPDYDPLRILLFTQKDEVVDAKIG
jgi:hypothetical protein